MLGVGRREESLSGAVERSAYLDPLFKDGLLRSESEALALRQFNVELNQCIALLTIRSIF
jgi:hypothetical protein